MPEGVIRMYTPLTIEGKFKTDEKNFIVLTQTMLEATLTELKCLEDQADFHILREGSEMLQREVTEQQRKEIGLGLNNFLIDHVGITDDILRLGYQYDSILQMIKSYADYLTSPPPPASTPES
jgi:hypothetical protein